MRILVVGWFSFENMGNTAGDMIARDTVCSWLDSADISYDIAVAEAFHHEGSLRLEDADPSLYTDLLFVCGPFGNDSPIPELLSRFSNCRLIGMNLTLMETLEEWNPFTIIHERDSSRASNPDIAIDGKFKKVPVVGVILNTPQGEYGGLDKHDKTLETVERLIRSREMAVVYIDTALENNAGGLRTAAEVESLIARMEVVITTRLHGTVLALKNGIPVVPIDSVKGGAKLSRQVQALEWPLLFPINEVTDEMLQEAFDFCLTDEARVTARKCAQKAIDRIEEIRRELISGLLSFQKDDSSKRISV